MLGGRARIGPGLTQATVSNIDPGTYVAWTLELNRLPSSIVEGLKSGPPLGGLWKRISSR